jgi:hypothetical protein
MWLFGLITLVEALFEGLIEAWHPDESWVALVPPGRRRKAQELLKQRERLLAGGGLRLLDCLQLSDKGQILLRHEETRRLLDVPSKEAGERRLRRLSRLRDSLAHSQDIVSNDWDMVLRFAARLEDIVRLGGAFARPRRARPRPQTRPR